MTERHDATTSAARSTTDAPEILDRYRRGASVAEIARELGVAFDHVARLVISARARRVRPLRIGGSRPAQLDDDRWLSDQLSGGAGVRTLSDLLGVRPSTVRGALRDHARRLVTAATSETDAAVSDPEQRFRVATERAARARAQLDRARDLQRSAVAELVSSGLSMAAVAARLGVDVAVVEELLAGIPDEADER